MRIKDGKRKYKINSPSLQIRKFGVITLRFQWLRCSFKLKTGMHFNSLPHLLKMGSLIWIIYIYIYIYISIVIIYILSKKCLIQIFNGCIKISFDSAKHTWNIRSKAFIGFNNIKCLWSLFLPYIKLLFPLFAAIKSFTIAFVFSMHFFKSIKFEAQSWTKVKFLICF